MVVPSPTPFGLGRNGCWPSRGSQSPRAIPLIFSLCCPLNDRRRAAHSFFKIGRLFSLSLFSCPSLFPHSSPSLDERQRSSQSWPNLSLFCVRSKYDLAGQVSAMLHLLQMGPSKVLTTFPFQIQSSWKLSLLELPPCRNTVTPSSDSYDMYTSTVQYAPPPSANAALSPHPRLQTSYPPSAHFISSSSAPSPPSLAPGCPSAPPASSPPLTLSGFFNGMLEVFEPGALNYFTFSRPTLSTLSASRNPILTHLPLSGFLDSLLCALIAPTPGLAFSLLMTRTLAAALSFSSGRAYSFLNFLPPLFLRLILTLIM